MARSILEAGSHTNNFTSEKQVVFQHELHHQERVLVKKSSGQDFPDLKGKKKTVCDHGLAHLRVLLRAMNEKK